MKKIIKKLLGRKISSELYFILRLLQGRDAHIRIQARIQGEIVGKGEDEFLVCTDILPSKPILYSAGIGNWIEFELQFLKKYNGLVYAFDPSPKSINYLRKLNLPKEFFFFPFALTAIDGNFQFYLPTSDEWVSGTIENIIEDGRKLNKEKYVTVIGKRLETIMKEMGHSHIDILKLDIEGHEFKLCEDILNSNISIGQILIETHQKLFKDGRKKIKNLMKILNERGYRIFYIRNKNEAQSYIRV